MINNYLWSLYKIASSAAGVAGAPYFYWHLKSRGRGGSFWPRLGLTLPTHPPPAGTPRIWIHGVSVGEILAAVPLVRELQTLLPQAAIIITTATETGQAVARRQFAPFQAYVCYFPLDIPWAVRRYLDYLRPQVFVNLESEIWPNFLAEAHRQGVRLVLANGRLSDTSFRRFLKYRLYAADIIKLFDIIIAGSPGDRQRFGQLGADPARLYYVGNLKYDRLLQDRDEGRRQEFGRLLAGNNAGPLFLAASTHPGEEEVVLAAYENLLAPYPALRLAIAPRHPERAPEISRLLSDRHLSRQFFSRLTSRAEVLEAKVLIIDTIGDLFSLYGLADVAFVGGSLIPHGGQNILEAAAWGRVPLFGPYLSNFRWAETIVKEARAGFTVTDAASLAQAAAALLEHPEAAAELGERARAALTPHAGAARRQAELIAGLVSDNQGG